MEISLNQDSKGQDSPDAAREPIYDVPTLAEYIVRISCCVGTEGDDLPVVGASTIGPFAARDSCFAV